MGPLAPLRHRIRELLDSERGMALPFALFAMIASMALATAAVMVTVDVQQGSHRDSSTKSAIAAADAGASVARQRLARYATVLGSGAKCLTVGSGGLLQSASASADGWCPEVKGTVGGATYSYRTTPTGIGCGSYSMCVVATGTTSGVSRRIEVTFNTSQQTTGSSGSSKTVVPGSTWSTGVGIDGAIGSEWVEVKNNANAEVNVGTNGNVIVGNNGNICGDIRHGVGKTVNFGNNATQCKGYKITEGNVTLPPVSSFMPSNIKTSNGNYRIVTCTKTKPAKEPTGCQTDTYQNGEKKVKEAWGTNDPWSESTKTISTSNNTTLTLGSPGSAVDYFACKLILSNNSRLIIAAGSTVRVFFDTPENCGLKSGAKQIEINQNAEITSTGYQPSKNQYELPGFYVQGSTSIATSMEFSNNSGTDEFVLYAPNTAITLKNNATYVGIIAGKTLVLDNNAIVRQDSGFSIPEALNPWKTIESSEPGKPEISPSLYYEAQTYVECSSTVKSGAAPNANC
jgi:hypothetical protein